MILVPPPPGPPSDSSWPDLDDLAQGPYVLVVEDDVELNLQLCWKLKEAGFRTKATHSATATLELIASRAPIIMVLDYLLPDMAAGELIQRLAEKGQKVPFVVVTGHGDQRIAVEMFRLGARDYLVKDSGFLQLLPEVVARVVAQVETERQRDELERALRKSEERFRQMAAGISDALVIVEQGKVVYANEQAEVIFGRRFEELAGLSLLDIAAPSERERLAQAMKAIAEGALVPAELEYWVQRPDGTRCCVHSRYSHHAELDGSLTRYVLTTDITARKLAEEALRESEEKYRTVVEEAADGIAIVQDERVMFANRSAVAFVGMAEEQVIGRPVLDFIHPSEVPRLLALYRRIRSGERFPGINQTVLRRWDGQEVPIELSARVVGYQGKEAILVVFRDISARLNAERSTRYLAQLVTSVMDAVIATDLEGHIKTWNPAAERIYGWSEQEVLGLTVREVLRSEYPGTTREAVLEEIRTHGHWSGQALQYRKDGSQIWVYATSSLVRGTGGETLGIVRVNRDITAVRAAEQALRQSEHRLREAQ
ncbi:MAG: PAS domain S-box protein, partial [candidate division WOR-3 bacterium]